MLKKNYKKYKKVKWLVLKGLPKRSRAKVFFVRKKLILYTKALVLKKTYFILNIKLAANNIFCTLKNDKTIFSKSCGLLNLTYTKRSLKFVHKTFIDRFLKLVKKQFRFKTLLIKVISPIKIRKRLVRQLKIFFRKLRLTLINFIDLKCFNGCRPKKIKRKKRKILKFIK